MELRIILFITIFWVVAHGVPDSCCDQENTVFHVYDMGKRKCGCNAKREGSIKYADGKLMVCNGKEWSALQYEEQLGSAEKPGRSCEHILENSKAKLNNGVYYIRVKGYTMVFKAVAGNNKDIYPTYNSDKTSAEYVKEALGVTNRYKGDHYKNRILLKDNWAKFDPSMVIEN